MTPSSLDALRKLVELAAKATPGPWKFRYEGSGDYEVFAMPEDESIGTAWSKDAHFLGLGPASDGNMDNATFICAARNAIPALSAALAEMKREPTRTEFNAWHPMETAPKDGSWVILYWDGEVTPGFYLDNSKTVYPWEGWSRGSLQVMLKGVPQNWMPFPTYP